LGKGISVAARKQKGRCRRCKSSYDRVDSISKICTACKSKCSTCGTLLTENNRDKTGLTLRKHYRCKKCVANSVKNTRGNGGFCQKSYDLKRHYGITKEERDKLFEGGCEVCGVTENLCVDHDHKSGKVRGCLCSKCNTAIGMFDDSREKLLSAERYLSRF